MNIPAKIWTWVIIVWGVLAGLAGLFSDPFDGYTMVGGIILLITGVITITYIWKDDAVRKKEKESADDERIARLVAERLK